MFRFLNFLHSLLLYNLSELNSLQVLGIENCNLAIIPSSIKKFLSVELLLLSGNSFKIIPTWLKKLKKLKSIELDNNLNNQEHVNKLKKIKIFFV